MVDRAEPVSGRVEVEVAHEALIRYWPRLRGWLEEDLAALRLREGIRQAALDWEAGKGDELLLLHRGPAWRTRKRWPRAGRWRSIAGSGTTCGPVPPCGSGRSHACSASWGAWLWRWR